MWQQWIKWNGYLRKILLALNVTVKREFLSFSLLSTPKKVHKIHQFSIGIIVKYEHFLETRCTKNIVQRKTFSSFRYEVAYYVSRNKCMLNDIL